MTYQKALNYFEKVLKYNTHPKFGRLHMQFILITQGKSKAYPKTVVQKREQRGFKPTPFTRLGSAFKYSKIWKLPKIM